MAENISFKISAIDDFSKTMSNLESQTKEAFDAIGTVGKVTTAAGLGIAAGFGFAVNKGNEFAKEIQRVKAISGATDEQFKALKESAIDLGASTTKSASEVASGMNEMAAMGFEVNEIISAMPGIIAGAEASGESLARVTEVTAAALNSFGLEASDATHVADVMAMAANASAASVDDLGYAFKYAAPIANGLGISMEELAAATAVMTDAGMQGEQAGTTLRAALMRLTNPPKIASDALSDLGIAITDAEGNMLPFSNIIGQLRESTEGMGDAAKMAALSQIFGTEAASGMLNVLAAGPDKLNELTNAFVNSDGAAKATADEALDPFSRAIEELGGAVESASIVIRDVLAPTLTDITNIIGDVINWFSNLSPSIQQVLVVITALTAVFALLAGPLMIFIAMIPSITAGFTAIATVVGTTAATLGTIIATVTGVVAALALIGVGLVVAYNKVDWFRNMVDDAWAKIKEAFNKALVFIQDIVDKVITAVTKFIGTQLDKIREFWDKNGAQIMDIVKKQIEFIKTTINNGLNFVKGIFEMVFPVLKAIVNTVWSAIKLVISTAIDFILGAINTSLAILRGDWKGAWESIKETASTIMNNIIKFFEDIDLVGTGKDIIRGLINGIGSMIGAVKEQVSNIAGAVTSTFKKILGIKSPSRVMKDAGEDVGAGLEIGLAGSIKGVEDKAKSLADAVKEAFNNSKSWVDDRKYYNELSLQEELSAYERMLVKYRSNAEAKADIEREIYRIKNEIEKQGFEDSKSWIDDRKYYNEMSLMEELSAWERIQSRYAEGTEERKNADREIYRIRKEINDKLVQANEEYLTRVKEVNEKVEQEEKRLNEEYEKAVVERAKSIRDFAGLFDEVVTKADVTGRDLLNNLNDQVTSLEKWSENIEKLAKRGIDEGLLGELRQMGPKANSEIAALNTLTDDQLEQYVTLWQEKNQLAREQAEIELTGLREDTDKQIGELRRDSQKQLDAYLQEWKSTVGQIRYNSESEFNTMKNTMPKIGKNAMDGLINGLNSQRSELMRTARQIADDVRDTISSALDINSPSRVMAELGGYVGEGLKVGMENSIRTIKDTASRLADAAVFDVGNLSRPMPISSTGNQTTTNDNRVYITVEGNIDRDLYDDIMRRQRDDIDTSLRINGVRRR